MMDFWRKKRGNLRFSHKLVIIQNGSRLNLLFNRMNSWTPIALAIGESQKAKAF